MIRLILALMVFVASATAQERRPSHCIALAGAAPGLTYLLKAGFRDSLPDHTVRLRYVIHASFLIQAGRVSVVTDYAGFLGSADFLPDVVTMNHAHSTHFTNNPDPRSRMCCADGESLAKGLCIAHLGHLHHAPSDEQYAALGRMDVDGPRGLWLYDGA